MLQRIPVPPPKRRQYPVSEDANSSAAQPQSDPLPPQAPLSCLSQGVAHVSLQSRSVPVGQSQVPNLDVPLLEQLPLQH